MGTVLRKFVAGATAGSQRMGRQRAGRRTIRFPDANGSMSSLWEWRAKLAWYLAGVESEIDGADLVVPGCESSPELHVQGAQAMTSKSAITSLGRHRVRLRNGDPNWWRASEAIQMARLVWDDVWSDEEREHWRLLGATRLATMNDVVGSSSGRVQIFATGPSLESVDGGRVDGDALRITCNSVVSNEMMMDLLDPHVICFGDPAFHFGHSDYAAKFRRDLIDQLSLRQPWLVVPLEYLGPLLATELGGYEKLVPLRQCGAERRTRFALKSGEVPANANVLTTMMLPVARPHGHQIDLFGCDGRAPDDAGFWQHSSKAQYDDLYQTVVDAHPAFFRDTDYVTYYLTHCAIVEKQVGALREAGVRVQAATPSFIPTLKA